jgi:hypothetical protein
MGVERRKFSRFKFSLDVEIKFFEKNIVLAKTIDLSQEGVRIRTMQDNVIVAPGTSMEIFIGKNGQIKNAFSLMGKAIHYSVEESGRTIVGIHIFHNNNKTKEQWLALVEQAKNINHKEQ